MPKKDPAQSKTMPIVQNRD